MKECVARAGRMHHTVFPLALRPKLPARKSGCAQLRGGVVVDGSFDANPHRRAVSTMFLTGSSAKGSAPKCSVLVRPCMGKVMLPNHQPSRLRRARGKLFEVSAFQWGLYTLCVSWVKKCLMLVLYNRASTPCVCHGA